MPPIVYVSYTSDVVGAAEAFYDALRGEGLSVQLSVHDLEVLPADLRTGIARCDAYVGVVGAEHARRSRPGTIVSLPLQDIIREVQEVRHRGIPAYAVLVGGGRSSLTSLDALPVSKVKDRKQATALAIAIAKEIVAALATTDREALALHPPAKRPAADDAGVVVSEVEGLLLMAERVVADEAVAEDLRDEVDARRRQLRDELRLIEQGKGSSAVLTGISGALLDLVRPEPARDDLGAALEEVADGIVALGQASSDEERVEVGEEVVAALDHVGEEVAEVIEANGWDDLKASMWRTAGAWVEEDFRPHLNAFLTAVRERALPVGGAATGAAVGLAGGPPWLAVTIVAAGLLRSLFPWIFRRRMPPKDQPPEDPPAE